MFIFVFIATLNFSVVINNTMYFKSNKMQISEQK